MNKAITPYVSGADSDRLLLVLLIALLWQNGASKELIVALAYIAM